MADEEKPKSKLEILKAFATWPVVTLLLGGAAIFALIAIFAPEDVRTGLFGAQGILFTILGLLIDLRGGQK